MTGGSAVTLTDRAAASRSATPEPRWILPTVAAATALVTCLGLWQIGAPSIWLDEAVSVFSTRVDWWPPWTSLDEGAVRYASLYYLLLAGWMAMGDSEAVVRSLSLLFAALTIPVAFLLIRDLVGSRVAALASLLLAFNPAVIEYAQAARNYSLLLLLTTLASLLFVRLASRATAARAGLYGLVVGLTLYAHIFGALTVLAHVAVLPRVHGRIAVRHIGVALAAGLLVALPLLVSMWNVGFGGVEWIPALDVEWGVQTVVAAVGREPLAWGVLVALPFGVASLLTGGGHRDWRRWLLLALFLVPVLVPLIGSIVRPMFLARYLTPALVPLLAIVAYGITALPGRANRILATIILVTLSVAGLPGYYADAEKEDWRSAAGDVLAEADANDAIVFHAPYVRQPFEYYVQQLDGLAPTPIYPSAPWGAWASGLPDPLPSGADAVDRTRGSFDRIWLVLAHSPASPARAALIEALEDDYRVLQEERYHGFLTVVLYGR
jgi:4-amino-4-deoxy-L-arabinose transferase-like glycosyltransferase